MVIRVFLEVRTQPVCLLDGNLLTITWLLNVASEDNFHGVQDGGLVSRIYLLVVLVMVLLNSWRAGGVITVSVQVKVYQEELLRVCVPKVHQTERIVREDSYG